MPETSSSSSSASSISFDEVPGSPSPRAPTDGGAIKLLCSYGGKILPRRHDGKLRYVGGHNRVLTVQRPLHFHGLYEKLRELCGWDAVSMRCQLPTEDMDALVFVTTDDDLASVLEEYDVAAARQSQQFKMIRVFLHPPAAARTPRSPSTPPLASRRRPPGQTLMLATGAGPSRPVRFILLPPIAPVSPARPELFCQ